jgi:hypothetical protein
MEEAARKVLLVDSLVVCSFKVLSISREKYQNHTRIYIAISYSTRYSCFSLIGVNVRTRPCIHKKLQNR